ncbi:hypothetical protein ACJQWK_04332 [Exserohilum turcicum]|uniref:Uncharacterized protein n=1 Tax=Exserohilum turcicum (strain 28A) TaxID=671987 RepID=R0ICL0_EXST2|nr:uncharacterized protein SETTUDRAFT_22899 [Exserohilum turcica Et28A]EOA82936.1 hypothetical protein SETTUDRAFT_22899 [Exserohilum turcica Et28A]
MSKPKKTVTFAPETKFTPGRDSNEFWRESRYYTRGEHACPEDSEGWQDTSLIGDILEQIMYLKVYGNYCVRDDEEVKRVGDILWRDPESTEPLLGDSDARLYEHPFCFEVLDEYIDFRNRYPNHPEAENIGKAVVIYQYPDGKFYGFEFMDDASEEAEAHDYMEALRAAIPAANTGQPRHVALRSIRKSLRGEGEREDLSAEEF